MRDGMTRVELNACLPEGHKKYIGKTKSKLIDIHFHPL